MKEKLITISISKPIWKKLTQIKLNEELDTLTDVIKLLLSYAKYDTK